MAGTDILTHISTGTLVHIIVYALLMHTQMRSESNENRRYLVLLHIQFVHYMECKCSDNLFETNVYIKCYLIWIEVAYMHALTRTHAHIHMTRNMA